MESVFDLHCDTLYRMYKENREFEDQDLAVNKDAVKKFNRHIQMFAIWTHDGTENGKNFYNEILRNAKKQIDFKTSVSKKGFVPLLAVENAKFVGSDEDVEKLYNDKVRSISLTWNGANALAGGASTDKGLTDLGRAVLVAMNRLKIATDLSHLSDCSFDEVIKFADFPFASHSCCRAVFGHQRNLSEKQLKQIAEKGGVVGLCFYPAFLGVSNPFDGIVKNIEYMLNIGLENNISLGSDFDGADMGIGLENTAKLQDLQHRLLEHFKDRKLVDKIFWQNATRFFDKLLTN